MDQKKLITGYDDAAEAYAANLFDELSGKPFERMILRQFAAENASRGEMIELGCGPGDVTAFLAGNGVANLIGTDVSSEMIRVARQFSPQLNFRVADMLDLDYTDSSFASAVAFYSIVHFDGQQLEKAFAEIYRVLTKSGHLLITFHIGDQTVHRDELFGVPVDLDFYFFQTEKVIKQLRAAGFRIIDAIERFPYESGEYPSKRAYLWVEKI